MLGAVGLLARVPGRVGAEGLRAVDGVLRRHDHGQGVVDGQHDEGEHHGGDEEGLWGGVALADLEEADPEEADADCGDADY